MTLRRAVMFVAVTLATTSALGAGLRDYSAVTYNTQGAKWSDVFSLVPKYDIVALQEAGAQPTMWGTATTAATKKCGELEFKALMYTWKYGTKGGTAYVYFLESDAFGNRVNAAVVTKQKAKETTIICPQPDNTKAGKSVRPPLGVKMPNDAEYFTTHAGSYGKNSYNDADNIIKAVNDLLPASGGICWAILGDFNRDAAKLKKVTNVRVIHSNDATHMGDEGSELDYMVARDTKCAEDMTAERGNGKSSDHVPVGFLAKR